MDDVTTLREGQSINGTFVIARNHYWKRHFNIDIAYHIDDATDKAVCKSFPRWREKPSSVQD